MKHYVVSVFMLVSLMAGCGGGGGGGGTEAPTGGTPATDGTPPPGGTGTPGGGGSTGTSSAAIVFPWHKSSATRSSVIVRGTASDPDGVSGVSINGMGAALLSVTSVSPSSSKSESGSSVHAISGSELNGTDAPTEVEWSVEVELEAGENALVVAVEDGSGEVTAGADEATIKYAEVPTLFTYDADDPRLLGWSTSLTQTGEVTRLVAFDYASQQITVYPELHDMGVARCFRSQTEEFLYLTLAAKDVWHLRSFDLTTRQSRLLSDIPPALIGAGPGFSSGPLLIQLVCGSVHESAYVLANYWEDGDAVKSRVLEIELSGHASMLTETDPAESPLWVAYKIALAEDALVAVREIDAVAPLTRIALEDGARSVLAPIDVGGLSMAAGLAYERVYVTTFEGVEEVRLTDPPSKQNISPAEPTDPLIFSQADSIRIDPVNHRVIVGDSDLDVLIAVELDTGERSELLSRKIGAGPPLITPRRLALTSAGTSAYVADDGGNATDRLFEIDLASGDKRVVGQISEGGINRSLTGLALDEEGGYAYVSRYDGGTVLRVDLATEAVSAITSSGDGLLENITDLLFDADNQRLLVADAITDAIVAVDVVTHRKQLISRAGDRGEGEAFSTLTSITMTDDGTSLYAADQETNQILHVDLETGDRAVVETPCALGATEMMRQVLYDAAAHELLILAESIFALDLETSICTRFPLRLHPLDIRLTQDGQILAAGFNAVTHLDRESGDVVIISK